MDGSATAATTGPVRIDGGGTTLVFDAVATGAPGLLYIGETLPPATDLAAMQRLAVLGPREARPDVPVGLTLFPATGFGFLGQPAIKLEWDEQRSDLLFGCSVELGTDRLRVTLTDDVAMLEAILDWRLCSDTGVLIAAAQLTNRGSLPARLHWLASLAVPLPSWCVEAELSRGRWGGEWQPVRALLTLPLIESCARGGRPGFDGAGYALVGEAGFDDTGGQVIAAHLLSSGNPRLLIETTCSDGRQLQLGAGLAPGEVVLGGGESFTTPFAIAAVSAHGCNGASAMLHHWLRAERRRAGVGQRSRKVHFNTWEAVGFTVDAGSTVDLAAAAAAIGCERFILDDGWFRGRSDDRCALGDWTPDPARFPDGLAPVIAAVAAQGMDFGLWVEPEMVSPDSNLARAHPDWCIALPGRPRPLGRHQLVLDLTKTEVVGHLFGVLDGLLHEHDIAGLKWDHNRDLYPGPTAVRQTTALYALLDRLHAAHPAVDIEACASGGGRTELALLTRCARVWASDNTDPLVRLDLQRALSVFVPLEAIGSHVGASPNPTTGRPSSMLFRARVALFAHMGVELDPRTLSDADRVILADTIAAYKRYRALLHNGTLYRTAFAQTVVSADRREAIALIASGEGTRVPGCTLAGLDPALDYEVQLVPPWPPAARYLGDGWRGDVRIDGARLLDTGLALPLDLPQTAWLVTLTAAATAAATRSGR